MKRYDRGKAVRGRWAGLAAFLLTAVVLIGCGRKDTSEKPFWPTDLAITLREDGKTEHVELEKGSMIYGTVSAAYLESAESDAKELTGRILSVMGAGIGDPMAVFVESSHMKEGYASISCDYEDAASGERTTLRKIYDGSMPDLEELGAYDCMVMVSFCYENGRWHMIDMAEDNPENYENVIAVTYDIQGPQGNYGVKTGQICGIFCEYY